MWTFDFLGQQHAVTTLIVHLHFSNHLLKGSVKSLLFPIYEENNCISSLDSILQDIHHFIYENVVIIIRVSKPWSVHNGKQVSISQPLSNCIFRLFGAGVMSITNHKGTILTFWVLSNEDICQCRFPFKIIIISVMLFVELPAPVCPMITIRGSGKSSKHPGEIFNRNKMKLVITNIFSIFNNG